MDHREWCYIEDGWTNKDECYLVGPPAIVFIGRVGERECRVTSSYVLRSS